MILEAKEVLEKILIPVTEGWKLDFIEFDESTSEVRVHLDYILNTYTKNDTVYKLYDGRKERKWRHTDLWDYKTFIHCKLPRYIDETGKAKTISVPWADSYERMSLRLEKKL